MHLAAQKVGQERVREIMREVVPCGFSEVEENEEVPWSVRGHDYDRVRSRLIDIITTP